MTSRLRRVRRDDGGAAAVEFALVLVLFLTLVFGIIQYGMYFFQLQAASAGTREGARLAALGVNNCTTLANSVQSAASGVKISRVQIQFAPAGTSTPGQGAKAVVSFQPASFGFPFLPFISTSPPPTQTGVSRVESVGTVTSDCDVTLP